MHPYRTIIRVLILLILIVAIGSTILQDVFNKDSDAIHPGDVAPDFTLTTLDGMKLTLSDLKGEGVILNFWGTYCPPCVNEMPLIYEKYMKYKDKGLTVVAVNVGENNITVSRFAERLGLAIPIALDTKREAIDLYRIGPMPATIFIRPDGTVAPLVTGKKNRSVYVGQLTDKVLEDHIKMILP